MISKTKNELYTREKVRSKGETINKKRESEGERKESFRCCLRLSVGESESESEFSGEKEEREGL